MANLRIGISSDFVLNNSRIGIGTINPQAPLDVRGAIKGDFNVSGASTLSVYSGFTPEFQNISIASTIGFSTSGVGTFIQVTESETGYLILSGEYNTVSEDIIVDEERIFEVSIGSTFAVGSLESISVQSHFSVPDGGTLERPTDPVEGMVRFNDDLNTLEFWNGFEWRQFTVTGASGRGVFGGGQPVGGISIEYVNISSTGNSQDFGSLLSSYHSMGSFSSSTRGLYMGSGPGATNNIEYITIASQSNSIDFGDLLTPTRNPLTAASSTRGLSGSGTAIDYVTISTLGNALSFGNLSVSRSFASAIASPVRAVFAGTDVSMEFVTIASTGNAVFFGNLGSARRIGGFSNTVRGVFGGSYDIEYITIASSGNSIDFGDMSLRTNFNNGGCSTQTRGLFVGGSPAGNTIEFVTISTTGNAQDFGDLGYAKQHVAAVSDSHGGLGGF